MALMRSECGPNCARALRRCVPFRGVKRVGSGREAPAARERQVNVRPASASDESFRHRRHCAVEPGLPAFAPTGQTVFGAGFRLSEFLPALSRGRVFGPISFSVRFQQQATIASAGRNGARRGRITLWARLQREPPRARFSCCCSVCVTLRTRSVSKPTRRRVVPHSAKEFRELADGKCKSWEERHARALITQPGGSMPVTSPVVIKIRGHQDAFSALAHARLRA
jgi:hypothetical protein